MHRRVSQLGFSFFSFSIAPHIRPPFYYTKGAPFVWIMNSRVCAYHPAHHVTVVMAPRIVAVIANVLKQNCYRKAHLSLYHSQVFYIYESPEAGYVERCVRYCDPSVDFFRALAQPWFYTVFLLSFCVRACFLKPTLKGWPL